MTPETPSGKGQRSEAPNPAREAGAFGVSGPAGEPSDIRTDEQRPGGGASHVSRSTGEPSGVRPRTLVRGVQRIGVLFLLWAIACGLAGCGSLGSTSFSGGGVPIGGSRLFGRVVAASSPSTSLPNVDVRVTATPDGGVARDMQTTTGQDGSFNFSNVLPGFSNGTVQVTATPADPAYRAQQIAFSVANGHTEQLIVTLPPSSFDPTTASSVTLSLASPAVPSGGSVQVLALVRDAAGKPLPVMPTLAFDGNFGTLNANGTFSVPAGVLSGTGTISAYWYSLPPPSQQIHVGDNGSDQPPNPPMLPDGKDKTTVP